MDATVVSIQIAPEAGADLQMLQEAELVAGKGIVGDRDHTEVHKQLTLVEAEQIEKFNAEAGLAIEASDTRRNITTRGVALNELVGKRFRVGEVEVRGAELCHPCEYIAGRLREAYSISNLSKAEIVSGLADRAGIRAEILTGGTVRVGDPIRIS